MLEADLLILYMPVKKVIIAILPSNFSVLFLHVENLGNTGEPKIKKKKKNPVIFQIFKRHFFHF